MTGVWRGTAAALTVCAVLSGCAGLRPGSDELTYAERRDRLGMLEAWNLSGRIVVRTGERAFQGRFRWSQRPEDLELVVRSPIGTNVMRVSGPDDNLVVETRGERRNLEDPEAQLSALVGWWLPVTSFPSWLLGIPDPAYTARERVGSDGTLASLEQRLWRIDIADYQLAEDVLVPRELNLRHDALELRVVIDRFDAAP